MVCCIFSVTVPAPGTQTVRVAPPGTTILKPGTGNMAGKQIITVHKGGAVANQPQIVTLVKTTQGMAVASVSSLYVCVCGCVHAHLLYGRQTDHHTLQRGYSSQSVHIITQVKTAQSLPVASVRSVCVCSCVCGVCMHTRMLHA